MSYLGPLTNEDQSDWYIPLMFAARPTSISISSAENWNGHSFQTEQPGLVNSSRE